MVKKQDYAPTPAPSGTDADGSGPSRASASVPLRGRERPSGAIHARNRPHAGPCVAQLLMCAAARARCSLPSPPRALRGTRSGARLRVTRPRKTRSRGAGPCYESAVSRLHDVLDLTPHAVHRTAASPDRTIHTLWVA